MSQSLPERGSFERELFELGARKTPGRAKGKSWHLASKNRGGKTAIYVPPAALGKDPVDLLVFLHGLPKPCGNEEGDEAARLIGSSTFALPRLMDTSQAAAVLVAPSMAWSANERSHPLGRPTTMNAFLEEVRTNLVDAGWSSAPTLRRVVIAGHSRAYKVLNALASARKDSAWSAGALAKVNGVCLLDTTYGAPEDHCSVWTDFAKAMPAITLFVAYQTNSSTAPLARCIVGAGQKNVVAFAEVPPPKTSIHCQIPGRVLPKVLAHAFA